MDRLGTLFSGTGPDCRGASNGGQSTCAVRDQRLRRDSNYAFRPAFLGFLGAAQLALGQVDQALEAASKALFKARCTRECWIVPELLELLARACPVDNRPKAEQELQEAIACARSQGSLPHELRASIRLGVMWSERGMQDAARRLVEAVYDRFREGWDVPDLKEGRKLLDQLTCSEADDTL